MTTTTTKPAPATLPLDQLKRVPFATTPYDGPSDGEPADWCLLCDRGLSDSAIKRCCWVEMSTCGRLIPPGHPLSDDADVSQGGFAVGPTCKRKIPRAYRSKAYTRAEREQAAG